ncbi:hypothetical protein K4039_27965 [Lyngbya sp. CCAP 1446/10]|nr:hypothetical protein [Lyngbya sp. CCAP 1446/10]MCW6053783.1 hypothetical protein [Lyngbya sp. CCAP 1446/10]
MPNPRCTQNWVVKIPEIAIVDRHSHSFCRPDRHLTTKLSGWRLGKS